MKKTSRQISSARAAHRRIQHIIIFSSHDDDDDSFEDVNDKAI
jgi:hypothetical protein